ncbi:MAG: hypothetical protein JWR40_653 [Massilia sp.]|nr:hypothetical protein [Massilia sp.]MDB5951638.1 hypothetical protein [Massilia sp.]
MVSLYRLGFGLPFDTIGNVIKQGSANQNSAMPAYGKDSGWQA